METQPPIVKLSRMISPKRLPFKKPARKSPKALADARATRPITRLVRYSPRGAEAYVYRKTGEQRWEQSMSGLPTARGTTVSRFATHADEPGVIYAANNRALCRSGDAGRSWKALDFPWPEPGLADGVEALACLPE